MERVINAIPKNNFSLEIEFNTGEKRLFDARPYLTRGVFQILQDERLFMQAYVALDTVCWPGDLDIAPETLYDRSIPIK
ncbi:MAG: DUF2442 domain-containing protein [Desulfuromonadales bacterium]